MKPVVMIRPGLFLLVGFVLGGGLVGDLSKSMQDREDNRAMTTTLNNMGAVYHSQGLYGQAVDCYQRALRMAEELAYTPSATVLGELRQRPHRDKPEALLALGDPDFGKKEQMAKSLQAGATVRGVYDTQFSLDRLPYTGEEVQEIARYFARKEVRVRRAASEEFIKQAALTNYRVIHFATHGLLDERSPKASCIVLSLDEQGREDGFLQVREIYDLKLDADLVVLSACNTGRGRLVNGEGVLGINRAFFYAGARSVLGSLWNVNDRASADLMNQFYFYLQKGHGKAEALRAAKLKFLKSAMHAHPYYWAAFVLQGEPKEKVFYGTPWWRRLLVCLAVLFIALALWRFHKWRLAST